ncbi:MAG TPA: shikimate dehydrogenase [Candidatus Micrarchaeia archaeon]|nr:shikimate dehydrogenase [Candidatus Micrarchaeia archaeon]
MSPSLAFLLGRGIAHSLSPAMHNAGFAALGIDARYAGLDVEPDGLDRAVARLRRPDCLGANVTMPYKRAVVDRADTMSAAVRRCGAGNLLVSRAGRLALDNTDVTAIRMCLARRARQLEGGTAAVVGAGGSAAAALEALRGLPVREVLVLARRPPAAAALAARYRGQPGAPLTVLPLAAAESGLLARCAVLVNATPLGMAADDPSPVPVQQLHPPLLVYDLVYRLDGPTALQRAARDRGCGVADGLTHLLGQAGPTFEALTARPAPWAAMRAALVEAAQREPMAFGWDRGAAALSAGPS